MNIRPLDWRDLSVLRRYRYRCLFFDSMRVLTRGPVLEWGKTLFASVAPTQGVLTYLAVEVDRTSQPVLGQVTFWPGASSARLTCLAPENALEASGIGSMLDFIIADLGARGAFHVLAEADEGQQACEALHAMGFAIYARQRIWQFNADPAVSASPTPWRLCSEQDGFHRRLLYNNLTPGLVQQMEPAPAHLSCGRVYFQGQDLLAYVDLKSGPNGFWVQPFIHPEVKDVPALLAGLLQNLPNRRQLPVYVCVRSYQAWLEPSLEALGAQPGPRQAVMVKRLALSRRVAQLAALPVLEGKQPEPTAPIAQVRRIWFFRK
jgi:hypothetical protein